MSQLYVTEPPTKGKVLLTTNRGEIEVELWPRECPLACRNFIQLCMEGYYLDTIFHRVVPGFIIQGGDPSGTGTGGQSIFDDPFADEFHTRLKYNRRGLLGMANNGKNDNGSQFFFTLGACPELQNRNTIFGRVAGDTIYNVMKIGTSEIQDGTERPVYPAKIIKTEVISNPFDDIVPRTTPEELKKRQDAQIKASAPPAAAVKKNKKLLSFADDDEEAPIAFKAKGKSSHDLLEDEHLKAAPVQKVVTKRRKTSHESDEDVPTITKEKPKEAPVAPTHTRSPSPVRPVEQVDSVQAQIEALKASLKRKPEAVATEPVQQEKGLSYIDEQRLKYQKKALVGGRKKGRKGFSEDDVLKKLSQFQSKLSTAKAEDSTTDLEEVKCQLHNVPNCQSCLTKSLDQPNAVDESDESWLAHKLIFPSDGLGKDLSDRERRELEARLDGGLEVIDPREKAGRLRLEAREKARKRDEKSGRNQFMRPDHGHDRKTQNGHKETRHEERQKEEMVREPSPSGNGVHADRWR